MRCGCVDENEALAAKTSHYIEPVCKNAIAHWQHKTSNRRGFASMAQLQRLKRSMIVTKTLAHAPIGNDTVRVNTRRGSPPVSVQRSPREDLRADQVVVEMCRSNHACRNSQECRSSVPLPLALLFRAPETRSSPGARHWIYGWRTIPLRAAPMNMQAVCSMLETNCKAGTSGPGQFPTCPRGMCRRRDCRGEAESRVVGQVLRAPHAASWHVGRRGAAQAGTTLQILSRIRGQAGNQKH